MFQTLLYHPALAGTPPEEGNWNYLGGLFPTPLYLHPCRRASMQAGLRLHDNGRSAPRLLTGGGRQGLFQYQPLRFHDLCQRPFHDGAGVTGHVAEQGVQFGVLGVPAFAFHAVDFKLRHLQYHAG